MTPAAILANPADGLEHAAVKLVRRVHDFGADAAVDFAIEELRRRGVNVSPPAIERARGAARNACRVRNERLAKRFDREAGRRQALALIPGRAVAVRTVEHETSRNPISGELRVHTIAPTPFLLRDPAEIPRREWLYGRHLIRREISLTLAPGGLGKTSLGMAEAVAMASGRKLLHDDIREPLRVWVFNAEEPADEMERRLAAIALHYGITQSDIAGRLFVDNGNDLPLVIARQGKDGVTVQRPLMDNLVHALTDRRIDVMVVDPFVSTHSVVENDNNAIQEAASAWKEVAYRANVAIALAHHTRKLGDRDATAQDSRGGDALVSKARDARALNPMSANDAATLGIAGHEREAFFWTGPGGKSNMSAKTRQKTWFRIVGVGLGNGTLSAPEDRVAVVTAWAPAEAPQELDPSALARLADMMGKEQWRANSQASGWIGGAVAGAFGIALEGDWKAEAKPIVAALERKRIIIRGWGQDKSRKPVPVFTMGSREMAEI